MAAASLLKPNQLLFSSRRQYFHSKPCCIKSSNLIVSRRFHSFKVKSFLDSTSITSTEKNNTVAFPYNFEEKTNSSIPKGNIHEGVINIISKTLRWLKAPAVVILLLLLTMHGRDPALAARSGGAMGGSSFSSSSKSSSSSSSRSSSSRSSSSSSRSSGSSGSSRSGGAMGGHSFSSSSSSSEPSSSSSWPSSSSTSSSSSWPSSSSTSSSSFWSHESSPARQYSSSTSYRDSYKSSSSSSPDWYSSSSYQTSSSLPTAIQRKLSNDLNQGVTKESRRLTDEEAETSTKEMLAIVCGVLAAIVLYGTFNNWVEMRQNRTRVIKLQVGLHVRGPSFEKSINRIAKIADTSTLSGLIYILKETTEALRVHFASLIAVNSSVKVNTSVEKAEEYFKKLSLEEREKFDKDTLLNLDNIKSEDISKQKGTIRDTYMVVTILVAAKGKSVLDFPTTITSNKDLKKALDELQTIAKSAEVQAVNVFWTPQDENEVMSREELYQVYPLFHDIR